MAKRAVNYPHRKGYGLDDEAWDQLEEAIIGTGLSPHDWCRLAAMKKLNRDHRLSQGERILFEQFARSQFLVTQGFQLLPDD